MEANEPKRERHLHLPVFGEDKEVVDEFVGIARGNDIYAFRAVKSLLDFRLHDPDWCMDRLNAFVKVRECPELQLKTARKLIDEFAREFREQKSS